MFIRIIRTGFLSFAFGKMAVFISLFFFYNPDASRDSVRSVAGDEPSQRRGIVVKWQASFCSSEQYFHKIWLFT
jgi:hypothetical protein